MHTFFQFLYCLFLNDSDLFQLSYNNRIWLWLWLYLWLCFWLYLWFCLWYFFYYFHFFLDNFFLRNFFNKYSFWFVFYQFFAYNFLSFSCLDLLLLLLIWWIRLIRCLLNSNFLESLILFLLFNCRFLLDFIHFSFWKMFTLWFKLLELFSDFKKLIQWGFVIGVFFKDILVVRNSFFVVF